MATTATTLDLPPPSCAAVSYSGRSLVEPPRHSQSTQGGRLSFRAAVRQIREQSINLFAAYNARVRVIYVEATEEQLYAQNREREASVPAEVIDKLIARWEVPNLTEAHRVDWIAESPGAAQLLTF